MNKNLLSKILLKVESFPSMPETGSKLLVLLKDQKTTVPEIEKILRNDPGLTTNILKLANSAFFGLPSKVASVRQAFIILGAKRCIELVIATCMFSVMDEAIDGYELPPGELWQHSIAVSTTAEALVKYKKISESENIFTSALLHDLGKLVLGQFVKEELKKIKSIVSSGVPQEIAEHMVLGTDHAEIGAQILRQWSFPQDVVSAVRFHHNPETIRNGSIHIDIVYLANWLCRKYETSTEDESQLASLSPAFIKRLGIERYELDLISDKIARWIEKKSNIFAFDSN
jgi:putative nucleotidyltransferase with HDIG domain